MERSTNMGRHQRPAIAAIVAALADLGIPCYPTPLRAARALAGALHYREFLAGIQGQGVSA